MKHLKAYESFENWGFIEWALDALTEVFDDYDYNIEYDIICIPVKAKEKKTLLNRVNNDLSPLKNKYKFVVYYKEGMIHIFQVYDETEKCIDDTLDNLVVKETRDILNGKIITYDTTAFGGTYYFMEQNTLHKTFVINRDYIRYLNKLMKLTDDMYLLPRFYLNYKLEKHFGVSGYNTYRHS